MKKLLLFLLCGLSTLGLAVGGVLVSADTQTIEYNGNEYTLNELNIENANELEGKLLYFKDTINTTHFPTSTGSLMFSTLNGVIVSNNNEYGSINFNTITSSGNSTYYITLQGITIYTSSSGGTYLTTYRVVEVESVSSSSSLNVEVFNDNFFEMVEVLPPPSIWEVILTAVSGFFTSMFALLTGVFNGVSSVFWADNAPTILLQVIIFGAAAALVAAAVYVITKLIKNATAKLKGGVNSANNKKGFYINNKRVSRGAFRRSIRKDEGRKGVKEWRKRLRRSNKLLRLRRRYKRR